MGNKINKLSYSTNITLITLSSLPSSNSIAIVLTEFAKNDINIDMISQTAPQGGTIRLSFTVSDESLALVLSVLGTVKKTIPDIKPEILPGNSKIVYFDEDMVNTPGVAAKIFSELTQANVQTMLVTTSNTDISVLINSSQLTDALQAVSNLYKIDPIETVF